MRSVLFIVCILLVLGQIQAPGTSGGSGGIATKTKRTQSMGPLSIQRERGPLRSSSSTSMSSSVSIEKESKQKQQQRQRQQEQFEEIELRSLTVGDLASGSRISLNIPATGTHRGSSFNPTRDGVYARARMNMNMNAMRRYGTIVGSGAAIGGVGGFLVGRNFASNSSNNSMMNNSSATNSSTTHNITSNMTIFTTESKKSTSKDTAPEKIKLDDCDGITNQIG